MYYRLSEDLKILFLRLFQKTFALYEEGKATFTDGRNKIIFAQPPKCFELDGYDYKYYPCVLVSLNIGSFKEASSNKYRGAVNNDANIPEHVYGYLTSATVTFTIYALTKEDRNKLCDLICMYLAKHETKQAFEYYGIRLQMPSWSGDNSEDEIQTNIKRFFTSVSLPLEADVEETADIIDAFGNKGLTVSNVISFIGDSNKDGEITNLMDSTIP